jgi:hypothetical protein
MNPGVFLKTGVLQTIWILRLVARGNPLSTDRDANQSAHAKDQRGSENPNQYLTEAGNPHTLTGHQGNGCAG